LLWDGLGTLHFIHKLLDTLSFNSSENGR